MPEGIVTPADVGTVKVTPADVGTTPNDQGSTPAGADTLLDSAVMGGKYKTVGELEAANKALQTELQGKNQPAPPNPDEDDRPVTRKELNTLEAQRQESAKFNKVTSKLGIKGARKEALEAYGEKAENREKSWEDMAIELEYTDSSRVARALGQSGDERGGGMPGKGAKSLEETSSIEEVNQAIDNMSDEEFMEQSNAMAGKSGESKGYKYS